LDEPWKCDSGDAVVTHFYQQHSPHEVRQAEPTLKNQVQDEGEESGGKVTGLSHLFG
jgi:hypothetical protein